MPSQKICSKDEYNRNVQEIVYSEGGNVGRNPVVEDEKELFNIIVDPTGSSDFRHKTITNPAVKIGLPLVVAAVIFTFGYPIPGIVVLAALGGYLHYAYKIAPWNDDEIVLSNKRIVIHQNIGGGDGVVKTTKIPLEGINQVALRSETYTGCPLIIVQTKTIGEVKSGCFPKQKDELIEFVNTANRLINR
ncbi:prepilin peptidase [Thiococcus pfennigii]|uniref:prepilin peptidase n=1 Tax=Thiococcus pfennigii TaxID=1057 RepID=UPI001902E4E2|nr:prepilin peptidase [Thiococcus pfennigii]